jgi:hypothetical protein
MGGKNGEKMGMRKSGRMEEEEKCEVKTYLFSATALIDLDTRINRHVLRLKDVLPRQTKKTLKHHTQLPLLLFPSCSFL